MDNAPDISKLVAELKAMRTETPSRKLFDKACKVLDRLQAMGLIGPYLGGQRRDILLTLDEWMEKVTAP